MAAVRGPALTPRRLLSTDDATRVMLTSAESGDYINANHVTMEVPGSGVVNRYIAAQGGCRADGAGTCPNSR